MILEQYAVTKLCDVNPNRSYLAISNLSTTDSDYIYILTQEAEPEVFKNAGFALGGLGLLELQHCSSMKAKGQWYCWTDKANIDIRVLEV